jgi:hypothetical protein
MISSALADGRHGRRRTALETPLKVGSAPQLEAALKQSGLRPMPERGHLFSVYSPESKASIPIGVVPFVSDSGHTYGGLSVSSGGHAKAVIVHLTNRTTITSFEMLDIVSGTLQRQTHSAADLNAHGVAALVAKAGKVKSAKPYIELKASQIRSVTDLEAVS